MLGESCRKRSSQMSAVVSVLSARDDSQGLVSAFVPRLDHPSLHSQEVSQLFLTHGVD